MITLVTILVNSCKKIGVRKKMVQKKHRDKKSFLITLIQIPAEMPLREYFYQPTEDKFFDNLSHFA